MGQVWQENDRQKNAHGCRPNLHLTVCPSPIFLPSILLPAHLAARFPVSAFRFRFFLRLHGFPNQGEQIWIGVDCLKLRELAADTFGGVNQESDVGFA